MTTKPNPQAAPADLLKALIAIYPLALRYDRRLAPSAPEDSRLKQARAVIAKYSAPKQKGVQYCKTWPRCGCILRGRVSDCDGSKGTRNG